MVYGVILAGGTGNRMGTAIPKQFLKIDGVPIIAYTAYSFLNNSSINKVIIVCHADYIDYMNEIIDEYFYESDRSELEIVEGGSERINSIDNAVEAILKTGKVGNEDVIIFHDAVRPFITKKIIEDSIKGAIENNAVVAGIQVIDTILYSDNGMEVQAIPDRSKLFSGQAPDSFKLDYYLRLRRNLSPEQEKEVFGTSKICELNNEAIHIIPGDELNFKITTPSDIMKAEFYLSLIRREDNESFKFKRNRGH